MSRRFQIKSVGLLPLFGIIAIGCGGGSGSSGSGGGSVTPASTVPVYMTDAPSTDYKNVWVTIYAVNFVTSTGATVPVFSSSTGLQVDVRHLHSTSGQLFEFLDATGIPAGTYTGAQVIVDNSVSIVPIGSTTATSYQFANANSASSGQTLLAVTFPQTFTPSGTNPVVLDFTLSNWSINSSNQVVATVNLAKTVNLITTNQVLRPISGNVQDLGGTAGSQTFNLVHDGNKTLSVSTNSSTTITNLSGAANPALTNAESVFIEGMISSGTFLASSIVINDVTTTAHLSHVLGTFSTVDATAGTFVIAEADCDSKLQNTQVTVDTTSTTTFTSDGITETGAQFFAQLAQYPNAVIEVAGTLSGSTLTAVSAKIDVPASTGGGGGNDHLVAAGGVTTNDNATAGTFTLTVANWEGGGLTKGTQLSVVTSSTTKYNLNGKEATEAAWFAALTPTTNAVALGQVSNGTLTAAALVIGGNSDGLGNGGGNGGGGNGGGGIFHG